MIAARKTPRFCRWFSRHCERRIAAQFSAVRFAGLDALRQLSSEESILVVSNHVSWWDPVAAIFVAHRLLDRDGYAMMDASNLRRLPFFRRVGAFGVDLDDPQDGAAALRYGAKLLRQRNRLVWIFAQGGERPAQQRPLGFRPGAAALARLAPRARVVNVALRYEFQQLEKPYMYIDAAVQGAKSDRRDVERARLEQEQAVTAGLERIEAALASDDYGRFATLLEQRPGALARFAQWALSRAFG